ncbi:MAG: hypothetical protein QOD61_1732, partial [Solirubrobacteraceae bacterium]|nr:hypothetical protein [Solirubrobacteraceae bacterium]
MTHPRRLTLAFVAVVLLLLGGGAAAALAAPGRATITRSCSTTFFAGDSRLGPAQLATVGPVAPILTGYDRFAGLTPDEFLARYWDPAANGGRGGWRYPPDNGFLLDAVGRPIEHPAVLFAGERLDRFGSEFGGFLAPEDTPYADRALPPMSLDVFDPA